MQDHGLRNTLARRRRDAPGRRRHRLHAGARLRARVRDWRIQLVLQGTGDSSLVHGYSALKGHETSLGVKSALKAPVRGIGALSDFAFRRALTPSAGSAWARRTPSWHGRRPSSTATSSSCRGPRSERCSSMANTSLMQIARSGASRRWPWTSTRSPPSWLAPPRVIERRGVEGSRRERDPRHLRDDRRATSGPQRRGLRHERRRAPQVRGESRLRRRRLRLGHSVEHQS